MIQVSTVIRVQSQRVSAVRPPRARAPRARRDARAEAGTIYSTYTQRGPGTRPIRDTIRVAIWYILYTNVALPCTALARPRSSAAHTPYGYNIHVGTLARSRTSRRARRKATTNPDPYDPGWRASALTALSATSDRADRGSVRDRATGIHRVPFNRAPISALDP